MTPLNMARHRTNPNTAFWKMIKEGNDHFEATHLEPKVDVCNRHYVFDAQQPANSTKPLAFNPTGACPTYTVAAEIAGPAAEKEKADEAQYAQFVRSNVPTAPIRTGLDGGMNRVFLSQVGGYIPPARTPGSLPPQPPPAVTIDSGGADPTLASRMLGGLLGGNSASPPTQVAAAPATTQERGEGRGFFNSLFASGEEPASTAAVPAGTTAAVEPAKPKPVPHSEAIATAKPKPAEQQKPKPAEQTKTEPQEAAAASAPKAKPAPQQQEANAAAPPAAPASSGNGSLINGAQAVVPAGSFASRWGGLQ